MKRDVYVNGPRRGPGTTGFGTRWGRGVSVWCRIVSLARPPRFIRHPNPSRPHSGRLGRGDFRHAAIPLWRLRSRSSPTRRKRKSSMLRSNISTTPNRSKAPHSGRTCLICVALICAVLAGTWVQLRRQWSERQLVAQKLRAESTFVMGDLESVVFDGCRRPRERLTAMLRELARVGAPERLRILGPDDDADARCELDDEAVETIAGMSWLQELDLSRMRVRDAQLTRLSTLGRLRRLRLLETPITDTGLWELRHIRTLRSVRTFGTKVTPAGRERLFEFLGREDEDAAAEAQPDPAPAPKPEPTKPITSANRNSPLQAEFHTENAQTKPILSTIRLLIAANGSIGTIRMGV